jgi:hypothetical protein
MLAVAGLGCAELVWASGLGCSALGWSVPLGWACELRWAPVLDLFWGVLG